MFNCAWTWTALYGLWTDTITNELCHGQCRAWQNLFKKISLVVVILQRRRVCSVLALEYVENCRSGVSFVAFCCFDGQILIQKFAQSLTAHTRSYKVTYWFLLWRMRWGSLFSCSMFWSCSLCFTVSKSEPLTMPNFISRNILLFSQHMQHLPHNLYSSAQGSPRPQ